MERRKSKRTNYISGELTDEQLDRVSGGTEVIKVAKLTVEGKKDPVYHIAKLDVTGKKKA